MKMILPLIIVTLYDTVKTSSYQFRLNLAGAHYFQLGHASTIRFAVNAAWYQSPKIYRNELFQIGGYRLLRGFDEEVILASEYTVSSLEYRYLIGMNSFLFSFIDGGWAKNDVPGYAINNVYIGCGTRTWLLKPRREFSICPMQLEKQTAILFNSARQRFIWVM